MHRERVQIFVFLLKQELLALSFNLTYTMADAILILVLCALSHLVGAYKPAMRKLTPQEIDNFVSVL